jgi:hypothetical protein
MRHLHGSSLNEMVDYVLRGANDINVVVGPLLWQPSDGIASKSWYFLIAGSEPGRGFRCDQIVIDASCHTQEQREACRMSFIAELARRPPLVIHNMGDEIAMARLCEALWPGDRITKIRKSTEADYAKRSANRAG